MSFDQHEFNLAVQADLKRLRDEQHALFKQVGLAILMAVLGVLLTLVRP